MREIAYRAVTEIKTYRLRGQTVMIDVDLAAFYGVPTRVLNGAVNRIVDRFPDDFMFRLSPDETRWLKSDQAAGVPELARLRRNPFAFTEQGIHAISYFLKSPRAIKISIDIIKSFHALREREDEQRGIFEVIEQVKRRQDLESKRLWDAIRSVRRLEEFREEISTRLQNTGASGMNEPSREKLDRIRYELERIEASAIGHRELFFLIMMLFGALLTAILFFPK
ncbi:MAG TPA: ORF6N domain-containing protein [Spirochaetia bacterium]|nr:ORF6N domain-containing protein [Spirochaetia bacterium]